MHKKHKIDIKFPFKFKFPLESFTRAEKNSAKVLNGHMDIIQYTAQKYR